MHSPISRPARACHSHGDNRARTTHRALLATLLLLCCPFAATHAASWDDAARVVYLDTAAPVAQQQIDAALDYAIAAWSARIDLKLERTDAAATPGYNQGLIVIRWLDSVDMIQGGSAILSVASTKRWLYAKSGSIAGAEIFLSRDSTRLQDSACLTHVLVHELGHALGLSHLSAESSVMHPDLEICHHTLTADDIAAAPYPQHICHAELLTGFDIYIPVINIGAKSWSARLAYRQGHWSVTEARPISPQPDCDDTWLNTDTLVLNKVWTQEHVWQAELENMDDQWHLKYAR